MFKRSLGKAAPSYILKSCLLLCFNTLLSKNTSETDSQIHSAMMSGWILYFWFYLVVFLVIFYIFRYSFGHILLFTISQVG